MRTANLNNIVLVSNEASGSLARGIADHLSIPYTKMQKKRFADGEIHHVFPTDISGRDMIIVGATPNDQTHQELIDLSDGSRYWNVDSVNIVVPYLGYSTMERAKPDSGEIPKGITRTRRIFRADPNFLYFVDLHSESVLHAHIRTTSAPYTSARTVSSSRK